MPRYSDIIGTLVAGVKKTFAFTDHDHSAFELDDDGDLMPAAAPTNSDTRWELDGNLDLMPRLEA